MAVHETGAQLRVDAPGMPGQGLTLGHDVQPGKEADAGNISGNMSGLHTPWSGD